MYLRFWGTRGSIPVPGSNTLKYGGNTPCIELRSDNNELFIFDAGTGIRNLGKLLIDENYDQKIRIFLSHFHWDHIQGLPFFQPLYQQNREIVFIGESNHEKSIEDLLSGQMNSYYFPMDLKDVASKISFERIESNKNYHFGNFLIQTLPANHSSSTLAFKIISDNKSIVYMPDNELKPGSFTEDNIMEMIKKDNEDFINFCSGADYLIHDSFYDELALKLKKGWGHSDNITLAYFSLLSKVKNLVLFHYNPEYNDKKIEEIVNYINNIFSKEQNKINCIAAFEGLRIQF